MHEHGSVLIYVHGNRKLIRDGKARTATWTFTQLLNSDAAGPCDICLEPLGFSLFCNRKADVRSENYAQ